MCLILFFVSCDNDESEGVKMSQVSFSFLQKTNSGGRMAAATPSSVIVTIKDLDANFVYRLERLSMIDFNGQFISEGISLEKGTYQLTEFFVVDNIGRVILASPLESSSYAHLVGDPLPLNFTVNDSTITESEVLTTDCKCTAKDFGYAAFNFLTVDKFCLPLSIKVLNESNKLWEQTTATITAYGNSTMIYNDSIESVNECIEILDGFESYTLSIKRQGFYTKDTIMSNATLKEAVRDTLTIKLVKQEKVTDKDGNIYNAIKIGDQIWMSENLKTTKYNDGTSIPVKWPGTVYPTAKGYGSLYSSSMVSSGKLCPLGWHVPTDKEWQQLELTLGMNASELNLSGMRGTDQGSKLSGGRNEWRDGKLVQDEDFGSSGFNGLPGGYGVIVKYIGRQDSSFVHTLAGNLGNWWSSTKNTSGIFWSRSIADYSTGVTRQSASDTQYFYCVRCIKD